jgi:hypothetical protein
MLIVHFIRHPSCLQTSQRLQELPWTMQEKRMSKVEMLGFLARQTLILQEDYKSLLA